MHKPGITSVLHRLNVLPVHSRGSSATTVVLLLLEGTWCYRGGTERNGNGTEQERKILVQDGREYSGMEEEGT